MQNVSEAKVNGKGASHASADGADGMTGGDPERSRSSRSRTSLSPKSCTSSTCAIPPASIRDGAATSTPPTAAPARGPAASRPWCRRSRFAAASFSVVAAATAARPSTAVAPSAASSPAMAAGRSAAPFPWPTAASRPALTSGAIWRRTMRRRLPAPSRAEPRCASSRSACSAWSRPTASSATSPPISIRWGWSSATAPQLELERLRPRRGGPGPRVQQRERRRPGPHDAARSDRSAARDLLPQASASSWPTSTTSSCARWLQRRMESDAQPRRC